MDIKSMYLAEIEQWMKEHGQPAFRAKQVFQWMHQKYVASTEDMSNLPKALRAQMDEEGFVHIEAEMSQESKSDGTIKFLYRLSDGQMIETVFMRHNYGNSVCISSQAGCRMGCRFCAPSAGKEAVIAAAEAAQCHDFIERLPDGYDTKIGDKGIFLSGGEAQRASVCCMSAVRNPPSS